VLSVRGGPASGPVREATEPVLTLAHSNNAGSMKGFLRLRRPARGAGPPMTCSVGAARKTNMNCARKKPTAYISPSALVWPFDPSEAKAGIGNSARGFQEKL